MRQDKLFNGASVAVTIGSFGVVLASIFYALSPVTSALPIPNVSMNEALQGMISGKITMMSAGIIGVISDVILIAGALLLITKHDSSQIEKLGWAWISIGVLIFVVVDSLSAGVLTQLAVLEGAFPTFIGFKLFFDICFIFGTITTGMAGIAIFASELKTKLPVISKPLILAGMLFSLIGLTASILYFLNIALPQVIGISIAGLSLVFGIYGIQLSKINKGEIK